MLILDNLTARYPDWSVTFSTRIECGEIVALTGRSGAGKSTLLGMLAGFVPVT
ncbi:ATP-binding cassette domain-containing protein, partial [Aeromonas veronii]